ncbi:Flp pilus assembly protein TadD, contains TPR repeats [Gemmobacter aquatilis]|uniref:Flp pilus assembly protein TadD, contains TPR repeats n=1 Tax=Gemmobacter aquatilis TaxID=933059 RepID=A0A1H8KWH5_9RHOB|nr:tetratricopeptide repeat protein [Gemmobacter aquatilis]SEN97209.1 Flp pilus assembly protein TadD, contains TPR repeats [Gemmobacter aquatilis]
MRLSQTAIALALALLAAAPLRAETKPAPKPAPEAQTGAQTGTEGAGTQNAGAYLAARVAAAESDYRAALGWFTLALQSDPDNPQLLDSAVISALAVGDFDSGAAFAEHMAKLGQRSQIGDLALIAAKAKAGDYAGLLAAQNDGRSVGALFDQLVAAWAKAGQGEMSDALATFDKVADTRGLEVFGTYHKALALASVGDFEGADALLSGKSKDEIKQLRRGLLAHAQVLSQLERNPDAVALLDATFKRGQDPAVDVLRARLVAGEIVPYDIAMDAKQGLAEVFYTMATALNGEAENGYTLIHSRAAAWLRPDHTEAVLMSAALLNDLGQLDLAAETYDTVPTDAPEFYLAEIGRAETLLASDRADAALEVMQALAKRHPDLLAVQSTYAEMLRRKEKFEEAVVAYDRAIALLGTPTQQNWSLFFSRGICHERQKRWDQAEADLKRALELSPDEPQVLNYLGYSYLELNKNLDEALSLIQRAVAARPDSGYITDSLAWAYFRLGRYEEAVKPMEAASVMEPVDPIVTDHLGDVYWAVGRRLEAQFQWRRALSYGPQDADAARIRRKLEVGLDKVLADEGAKPLEGVKAAQNDG